MYSCSYSSFVDTIDDSYFKVLDLESGVAYNFTVDVDEYYQMDLGFSIHLNERPKERNAILTVDNPGISNETVIFTPEEAGEYYIRTYSNYDWGFFEITVYEDGTSIEKIVEPYFVPMDWRWLWISVVVLGGIVIFCLLVGLSVTLIKKVDWNEIRFPKIDIDWDSKRDIGRARRAQRRSRRNYKRQNAIEKRYSRRQSRKTRPDYKPIVENVSIVYISDTKPKCMVSGLYINFDEVLACPNCRNIAKKPMLTEWLRVKGSCPICRTKIILDLCPKAERKLE